MSRPGTGYRRAWALGAAGLLVMLFGAALPAAAYSYRECYWGADVKWDNARTKLNILTISFPPGGPWDRTLRRAIVSWAAVGGSSWYFQTAQDTDGTYSHGNGVNEVYFTDDLDPGVLGQTAVQYSCSLIFGHGIDETDIGFNVEEPWSLGAFNYQTPCCQPFSFEGVALHELGHSLGLTHENDGMATMNAYYPNSGPTGTRGRWTPLADDRQGLRYLYRDSLTEVELAASALKRTGPGQSDRVPSAWAAARGTQVTFEFSFGNLGTSDASFDLSFRLSPDQNITTSDIPLNATTGWATPGFTGTFSWTVTIPWIQPGDYYIGFILDPSNTLVEHYEDNNEQHLGHRITIT